MADDNRNRIRKLSEIGRNITLIGQLGLTLVIPIVFCLFVCYWLNTSRGVGGWIYIPGLILGIGSSCMTAWKLYQSEKQKNGKPKENHGPSFSRHY